MTPDGEAGAGGPVAPPRVAWQARSPLSVPVQVSGKAGAEGTCGAPGTTCHVLTSLREIVLCSKVAMAFLGASIAFHPPPTQPSAHSLIHSANMQPTKPWLVHVRQRPQSAVGAP